MSRGPNETGPDRRDDDDDDDGPPPKPRLLLHAGLFLATFLTTTATGALEAHRMARRSIPIRDGLPYSLPLMFILLCHEFGHYIVARLHGVPASLPYFIPLPPGLGLGTLGAVIGMRKATTNRKQLIDVGAAGPLAGLRSRSRSSSYGLMKSEVGPLVIGMQEGNSILYAVIKWIVKGAWLPNSERGRIPASHREGGVGRPAGDDDQPAADRAARRRAHRDRLLRQPLQPVRRAAAQPAAGRCAVLVFFWVLHATQRRRGAPGGCSRGCTSRRWRRCPG